MIRTDDPKRERLIRQVLGARTLPAIAEASQALRQWMQERPDDQGMRDGFEALAMMQEIQEWKLANPEEWQAQQEEEQRAVAALEPERGQMLRDARQARTLAQLDRAERDLFQWAADHPEDVGRDFGIIETMESVLTRREALEAQPEPMLAGQAA